MALLESLFAILVSLDIFVCTLWQAILYPFGLASKPTGRKLISSFVGEASYNGHSWARTLELIIDLLFLPFETRHCYKSFIKYR